jgi:hypothetical protein
MTDIRFLFGDPNKPEPPKPRKRPTVPPKFVPQAHEEPLNPAYMNEALRLARNRQEDVRKTTRERAHAANARNAAAPSTLSETGLYCPPASLDRQGGGGSGGQGKQGGSGGDAAARVEEALGAGALDEALDCVELAKLLPGGDASGIFEVIFPNGDSMGVVVDARPSQVS